MTHTVCEICKGWIFGNGKCTKCEFNQKHNIQPHNCKRDGHVGRSGLITMFVCKFCGYTDELAPELQPSESELCVMQGVDPYEQYDGEQHNGDW